MDKDMLGIIEQTMLYDESAEFAANSMNECVKYINAIMPKMRILILAGDMTAVEAFGKIKNAVMLQVIAMTQLEEAMAKNKREES